MKNPISLNGKTILVTGGGQGIGRALAEQVLSMGGNVALLDLNQEILAKTQSELDSDNARIYCGDVTDQQCIRALIEKIVTDFGDLHGLLNNAGIIRPAMINNMTLEQWKQVVDINLTGAFICLQAVGSYLVDKARNGDDNPGSIVNVSSDAGRRGTFGQINYGAAKSGLLGLTMCSAREWGRYNINVNSVCYGLVETAMTETIRQDKFRDKYLEQIPLARFSTPNDVAPATCFLLTEAAAYITGQHLSIDGGFHIST